MSPALSLLQSAVHHAAPKDFTPLISDCPLPPSQWVGFANHHTAIVLPCWPLTTPTSMTPNCPFIWSEFRLLLVLILTLILVFISIVVVVVVPVTRVVHTQHDGHSALISTCMPHGGVHACQQEVYHGFMELHERVHGALGARCKILGDAA